jgi:hypothetical protein
MRSGRITWAFPFEEQMTTINEIITAVRRKEDQQKVISCLLAVQTNPVMKLKLYFVRLFSKRGKVAFLFSEAEAARVKEAERSTSLTRPGLEDWTTIRMMKGYSLAMKLPKEDHHSSNQNIYVQHVGMDVVCS